MINNFAKERHKILTVPTCTGRSSTYYMCAARRAQRYVRYVRKSVTSHYIQNIRLSTNDQLIFLPSAKRGVDKKWDHIIIEMKKNLVLYHSCTLRIFKKGRTLRTLCRVPYVLLIIGPTSHRTPATSRSSSHRVPDPQTDAVQPTRHPTRQSSR